jgi:NAD(P)H-dependent FMN reductase
VPAQSSQEAGDGFDGTRMPGVARGACMLSTIALLSSSRRHGNTGQLTDRIARELGIEVIDLGSLRLSAYDYEHRNRGDDFEPLMRHVLGHAQLILATPVYWYAVSPPMKVFLDRISDLLEIPELLGEGRRLRGKNAYVVCTSVCEEPDAQFLGAWRETFGYLGMHYGGVAHANCRDGLSPARLESVATAFAAQVRQALPAGPA